MFCMNCGMELPDGAKFCLNCGTPQGKVSTTSSSASGSINLANNNALVPAVCPNCSSHLRVDISARIARCESCGTECLVQDAINALNVSGNVNVGNATININGTNINSLLNRVEMMLAEGDFDGAMQKCDSILDIDPTESRTYLYLLMSELRCKRREELANQMVTFAGNKNYIKAMKFGNEALRTELNKYIEIINNRVDTNLYNPEIGDEIYFGSMDGHRLWWKVLLVRERTALIISKTAICNSKFNMFEGPAYWDNCSLRNWLNNEFYNTCFSAVEKQKINSVDIKPITNIIEWRHGSDTTTTDRIFLLSDREAKKLFQHDYSRATGDFWWLRFPAGNKISGVNKLGEIVKNCMSPVKYQGVRPAMWIDLP